MAITRNGPPGLNVTRLVVLVSWHAGAHAQTLRLSMAAGTVHCLVLTPRQRHAKWRITAQVRFNCDITRSVGWNMCIRNLRLKSVDLAFLTASCNVTANFLWQHIAYYQMSSHSKKSKLWHTTRFILFMVETWRWNVSCIDAFRLLMTRSKYDSNCWYREFPINTYNRIFVSFLSRWKLGRVVILERLHQILWGWYTDASEVLW